MEKILTISIAAYNAETYIKNTLESLEKSSYLDALEVFIIDDGGTDLTYQISKEFEKKYPGVFCAVHKENGGYGSTVMYSIEHATGKYFKLLDGDDYYLTDGLDNLISFLLNANEDVVVTNYFMGSCEKDSKIISYKSKITYDKTISISSMKPLAIGMWALTFKTEILLQSNLDLFEHTLYTDAIYATVPFAYANTIVFKDYYVYFYRIGVDGQSISITSRIRHQDDMIKVSNYIIEFCSNELLKHNVNSDYLLHRAAGKHRHIIKTLLLNPFNHSIANSIRYYDERLKEMNKDIYREVTNEKTKATFFIKFLRFIKYRDLLILKVFFNNGLKKW